MNKESKLIKCHQCGYEFQITESLRCPRCYSPVLNCGGCKGSCGSCAAGMTGNKDKNAQENDKSR